MSFIKKIKKDLKNIIGSNLSRYSLIFDKEYFDYDSNADFSHRPKFKLLFESEKIIVRRTTSGNNNTILGYFDNQNHYSNDSLIHLIRWSNEVLKFQKPEVKEVLEGQIIKCSLAINPPNLPADSVFQLNNGQKRTFNFFEVKKFKNQ